MESEHIGHVKDPIWNVRGTLIAAKTAVEAVAIYNSMAIKRGWPYIMDSEISAAVVFGEEPALSGHKHRSPLMLLDEDLPDAPLSVKQRHLISEVIWNMMLAHGLVNGMLTDFSSEEVETLMNIRGQLMPHPSEIAKAKEEGKW